MPYPKLKSDDIFGSREISFTNRKDSIHPQLMRLCMDFELVVLQVQRRSFSHISKRFLPTSTAFLLSNQDYRNTGLVFSPWCDTMMDLEIFAKKNHIDILHDHIFGDINQNDLR
ncbi:MAG: hypothetical protein EOO53_02410 [Gammaproteobacteria bacterium]|nr:MAG: hypothetical protein EOO53_02410 [Gammaproteobacteria bacterium]